MSPDVTLAAEFTATSTYTNAQYLLVLYGFVIAVFALFAAGVYGAKTSGEVSKAYRTSAIASTLICWVATLAYVVLILEWVLGFHATADGQSFTPGPGTVITELRYMDWSVTVPLLTIELLGVAALTRARSFRLRTVAVPAAFLMIITGFLGVVFGEDARHGSTAAFWVWGVISTAFFVVLYAVAAQAYRATAASLGGESLTSYRNALILLFSVFGAYPLAYLVPLWAGVNDSGWATTEQLVFTFADIIAKVGFGVLIHKVAKLRTAADALEAGGTNREHLASTVPDTLPAEVWLSGTLISLPATEAHGAGHAPAPVSSGAAHRPAD